MRTLPFFDCRPPIRWSLIEAETCLNSRSASPRHLRRETPAGPISQIIQAAVDGGIAACTVAETIAFVRGKAPPGSTAVRTRRARTRSPSPRSATSRHAAEAIVERGARLIDVALAESNEETVAAAAVAPAEAKVLTTEVALLATNKLFELGGTRSSAILRAIWIRLSALVWLQISEID